MPKFIENELFHLLREDKVEEFNQRHAAGEQVDLRDCDFRNCDLRGLNASGLDLSGAYFRGADLRGIDFRNTTLSGASLAAAQISGCFFSNKLSAQELDLSVTQGTRLREQ